jgi:hypothetical protein
MVREFSPYQNRMCCKRISGNSVQRPDLLCFFPRKQTPNMECGQLSYHISKQDLALLDGRDWTSDASKAETLIASARFLKAHLPPKIAKRIKELQSLPFPFQKDGGSFQEICRCESVHTTAAKSRTSYLHSLRTFWLRMGNYRAEHTAKIDGHDGVSSERRLCSS